jgi:hypothetical protein
MDEFNMKNLITYKQYLNEGWFSGKHDGIGRKIYQYVFDRDDIEYVYSGGGDYYTFYLKPTAIQNPEADPLGEDDWNENIDNHPIRIYVSGEYKLRLDGENIDVSSGIVKKIYKELKNKAKKIADKKLQDKIDRAEKLLR